MPPKEEVLGFWKACFVGLSDHEESHFDRRILLGLFILALLIRIPLLFFPEVIHNDGTAYIQHARQFLAGDWSVGRTHPLYPFLIALAHFVAPSDEIAGILVSVILGALLVFPVFALGKTMFNERIGLIAALFATFHPFLYIPSGSVLTESTFHFFLATSVLFGWRGFDRGRWSDILLFAFFGTLSYLTRPEGFAFLAIFVVWVLFVRPPRGERRWTRRVGLAVLASFFFVVFSFPYLLQLRKETGRWQISKKVAVSVGSLSEDDGTGIEMIRVKKEMRLSSFLKEPFPVLKKIGLGLAQSLYLFQQVINPVLTVFLILAFVSKGGALFSQKVTYYLFSYLLLFFGLIHPFFWLTRRYTSHVISICLPWAAFGFVQVTDWLRPRLEERKNGRSFPVLLLGAVLLVLFVQGRVIHNREHRFIQREAGLWMRDHLPRETKIMSSLPQEAFYAELPWVRIPPGNSEEIVEAARSQGVRYLVIDEKVENESPGLQVRLKGQGWVPIQEWQRKDQRTILFEIDRKRTETGRETRGQ